MFKLCLVQVALLLALANLCQAADSSAQLTLSTNATTVPIGQRFIARCDLANWVPANATAYQIWLCSQVCISAHYHITVNGTGKMQITPPLDQPFTAHNLTITAASYNRTSFTWTLVPHNASVKQFYCLLNTYPDEGYFYMHSNEVLITFGDHQSLMPTPSTPPPNPPPISLTFSTNATSVQLGQPFTARCDVANLVPVKYTYYSIWLTTQMCSPQERWHPSTYRLTVNGDGEIRIRSDKAVTTFGLTVTPASSNQSSLSWTVIPHTTSISLFECWLLSGGSNRFIYSNQIGVAFTNTSTMTALN